MYASAADLQRFYPDDVLADLSGPGRVFDPDIWTAQLVAASHEIDGWLSAIAGVSLPLVAPPPVLIQMSCDIAVYRRMVMTPQTTSEDQKARYDSWLDLLRTWVRHGAVPPGVDGGAAQDAAPAALPRAEGSRSVFNQGVEPWR
ncbi:MAG: DUF1320 domain-containing protein [Alphaproteobacteria bacterium]|nr:MAG: DUF1320 domain-containing protein [Alphaproteobacteria bacterium]